MSMASRWTSGQIEKAHGIVNDIAEEIDNKESRSELRQALAIYADLHYDALQKRACEKMEKLSELMERFAASVELMGSKSTPPHTPKPDESRSHPSAQS